MEKYIDKDALVAEIENLENTYKKCPTRNSYEEGLKNGRLIGYKDALHKINTLEIKEMDLDTDFGVCWGEYCDCGGNINDYKIAKHFFELGLLSTITEEDCKLIWNIGDEIPNMPEEEFFKELLRRYKAQKGE